MAIGTPLEPTKGNLYMGKNPWSDGLTGEVGDAYFYFYGLEENEIGEIHEN